MKRLIRISCAFFVLCGGISFDGNYIFAEKRKLFLLSDVDQAELRRDINARITSANAFICELNKKELNLVTLNSTLEALVDTWATRDYYSDLVYKSDYLDIFIDSEDRQCARQSFLDRLLRKYVALPHAANCVKKLLLLGADINGETSFGITPLIRAICDGHIDVVNVLLAYDPNIIYHQQLNDDTAIIVAARTNNLKMLIALTAVFAQGGSLISANAALATVAAAWEKCPLDLLGSCVKPYIDIINAQNNKGDTALMMAAKNDNYAMVLCLLMNGADKNLINNDGKKAINFATNAMVIRLLNTYSDFASNSTVC
jgi:disulfide oxidoreductase YuzD